MIKRCFMPGAALVLLSACNGLMGGLYDEAAEESSTGSAFTAPCTPTTPGTIRVDATDYAVWTYIDLTNRTVEPLPVDAPEPEHWDFAIHRYDAKTNGGEVAATDSEVLCAGLSPASAYVPDQWTTETIITDVSGMMDGVLLYAESFYNPMLSSWLDVDKSSMPPVYTLRPCLPPAYARRFLRSPASRRFHGQRRSERPHDYRIHLPLHII